MRRHGGHGALRLCPPYALPRLRILAAHGVRVFPSIPPSSKTEGAGKAGCRSHPWSACNKKARGRTTGTSRNARPSLRNGFNGFLRALPGETGLCCHRRALRQRIARGAPASGRQDHTTSPSASCCSSNNMPRPSHPASNVCDDRETPLLWQRDAGMIVVICPTTQEEMCTTGSLRMAGMRSRDSPQAIASASDLSAEARRA